MSGCGYTWPEQNAVNEWVEKTGISVAGRDLVELKNAVSAYRIEVQQQRDKLQEKLDALYPYIERRDRQLIIHYLGNQQIYVRWERPLGTETEEYFACSFGILDRDTEHVSGCVAKAVEALRSPK